MKFDSCQYSAPALKPVSWIERNRHPLGHGYNMGFGVCQVLDGMIRVCSFGRFHTRFTIEFSRRQTAKMFKR